MQFVLANRHLIAAGGTEVHLVTIAEQLRRLGHDVTIYSPEIGPFGDHMRRRGLEVSDSLRALPESCDVAFAQDAIVVHELAQRYPAALSVFRVCGDVFDFQLPPQLHGVVDLVVVTSDRYERVAQAAAVPVPVLRLRVPIDTDRLVPLGTIRERPERAVVLGNYGERDELVRDVWGRAGLELRCVGGDRPDVQRYDVADAVADADIVVAKGRAALDAMACARAVYVFDIFGGDGWVTPETYASFEADNFAGQATGRVIDAATLERDLSGYRQEMGVVNRDLVLQHHGARDHVIALLAALGESDPGERDPNAPLRELARLTAMAWSWEETARQFRTTHWPLRAAAARAEEAAAQAREEAHLASCERDAALEQAGALRAQIDAMRGTRAWRLATAWWRVKAHHLRRRP